MARPDILAIIQAGGAGGRLDVLTRERAKPALPFCGRYRLVDFPLSNLSHSGIDDVWLDVQFQAGTLAEQVGNGRPWDLDRTVGGLRLLMPQQGVGSEHESGFATGNADGLFRIRDLIADRAPELVVVCSADHVYRFDVMEAVSTHRRNDAECTVVTTEVPLEEADDHAVVTCGDDGRVTGFVDKPEDPPHGTVATEVFVHDAAVLLEVLDGLHRELYGEEGPGDSGLGDFGDHLLPRLVDRGRTFAHPLPGYWRDLGTPERYVAAHRDLLRGDVGLFDDPHWPIRSMQGEQPPARIHAGAVVEDSLVSPGADVHGTVRRSVLGLGVVVAAGAVVEDSVLLEHVAVGPEARVCWAVVDTGCHVGDNAEVGEAGAAGAGDPDPDHLVLVGRDSQVPQGGRVPPGSRLEPGTTATA